MKKKKVIKAAEADKTKEKLKGGDKKQRSLSEIRNAMYGKKEGK